MPKLKHVPEFFGSSKKIDNCCEIVGNCQFLEPIHETDDNSTLLHHLGLIFFGIGLLTLFLMLLRRRWQKSKKSIDNQSSFLLSDNEKIDQFDSTKNVDVSPYLFGTPEILVYTSSTGLLDGEMTTVRQAHYSNPLSSELINIVVKTYPANKSQNFDNELAVLAWLRKFPNDHVVKLVGWFKTTMDDSGGYYCSHSIMTSQVPGITLRHFLARHTVDWRQACFLAKSLTDGLVFLHSDGFGCADHSNASGMSYIVYKN